MNSDLTTGEPRKVLWAFCLPMFGSIVFQQLYNLADSLVAGKYIGENALAAVGNSYNITLIFLAFAFGCNIGCSVVTAQLFGAKSYTAMKTAVYTSLIASGVLCLGLMAAGLGFTLPLLRLMKTQPEILADSCLYLTIYIWGLPFLFYYNIATGIFSAMGDSRTPLYLLILAFFLNVAGDLFFIIGCSMGVGGGALATTLSQAVCTLLSFLLLERKLLRMGFGKREYTFDRMELVRMMRIAVPAALQQSVVSLGNVCVQTVTNSFGSGVMAGCTAANKAVNLVSAVPINWGNALSNYVGQNVGAGRPERIRQGVRASLLVTGGISLVMILLMELVPEQMIGWFVEGEDAQEVIRVGASYLRVVGWFLTVFSGYMVIKSVFKGVGDMRWFVGLTLSSLGIRVLFAFVLAPVLGAPVLWWSVAVGWCVSTVLTVLYYLGGRWKKYQVIE